MTSPTRVDCCFNLTLTNLREDLVHITSVHVSSIFSTKIVVAKCRKFFPFHINNGSIYSPQVKVLCQDSQ